MRALSVKPDFASLIASGKKTIELRSRPIRHRGPLLICATQPAGIAMCVVTLADCRPFTRADARAAASPYRPGLWAWELTSVRRVEPVEVRGQQGLFHVPDERIRFEPVARRASRSGQPQRP